MRLIAGPDPEARAQGHQALRLELETHFFDGTGTRVLHVERLRFEEPGALPVQTLVWREIRPHSGRTVLFEVGPEGPPRSSQTVGGEVLRREHVVPSEPVGPLALLEAARTGELSGGRYPVFQPLACDLEVLSVGSYVDPSGGHEEHILELSRPEGDSAGRYVFEGRHLCSFRMQAGGPLARRVSRTDYERLLAEYARGEREEPRDRAEAFQPDSGGG